MKKNRLIYALLISLALLASCQNHEEIFFDTPFARIEDNNGQTTMVIDHSLESVLSEIRIVISASKNYFTEPITVEYETIVGDGLEEGVDFKIQPSHRSPITFEPGTYVMPIRVMWYKPADYDQGQIDLFSDNIKEDRTPEDLLFQVMLDLGVLPSSKIEETTIDGKKVFSVADGYLIACFDKDISEETVKMIAQKQPYYAVFRDGGMASDSVATNFEQIFEAYSPQTQRRIL